MHGAAAPEPTYRPSGNNRAGGSRLSPCRKKSHFYRKTGVSRGTVSRFQILDNAISLSLIQQNGPDAMIERACSATRCKHLTPATMIVLNSETNPTPSGAVQPPPTLRLQASKIEEFPRTNAGKLSQRLARDSEKDKPPIP